MKKFVIIIFALFCFLGFSEACKASDEQSYQLPENEAAFLDAYINGYSSSNTKRVFEKKITDLLFVAKRDFFKGMAHKKLDINARRKYFTDRGWKDYQLYLEEMKAWVDKQISEMDGIDHLNVKPKFCYGTQFYDNFPDGTAFFRAEGSIMVSPHDAYDSYGSYNLQIRYDLEKASSLENVKIDSWIFNFKEQERCPSWSLE